MLSTDPVAMMHNRKTPGPLMLHAADGSWELYPPLQRMPHGNLLGREHTAELTVIPRSITTKAPHLQGLGGVVLLSFFIMVLFRLTYPRRFVQFFKAAISNKGLNQLLREWSPMNILSIVFSLMHTMGLAILLYAGGVVLEAPISFTGNWIIDLALLASLTTFVVYGKYATIVYVAWMFQVRESGRRYLANHVIFSFITSLMLFPILLSLLFNPSLAVLVTSAGLIIALHIVRLVRSFSIGLTERHFSLHYLILYLCTLEIVPLVLLFKAVSIVASGASFA